MTFATLESRVNASVLKHLANATALFDGATDPVPGDFRRPYQESHGGEGMVGAAYTLKLFAADVPDEPEGRRLVIRGDAYIVALAQPDGTGFTTLQLDLAA